MDDLRQLSRVVLARAETLVELRLDKVPWDEVRHLSLRDLLKAVYLDGVRDTVAYIGHLSDENADA